MKSLSAVVVGLVMLLPPLVRAQDESSAAPRFTHATIEQSERNLVLGLDGCSDPNTLISAALTMRQLKQSYPERSFSSFVIPLMRIVKNEDLDCTSRITAALALHELHSARGDFAIKRTAIFTDCKHTKHICSWLAYYQYLEDHPDLAKDTVNIATYTLEPLPEEFVE